MGQHLALAVAAHLARTQLVSDPLAIYDAAQLGDMLDIVAAALAKVAPLYAQDPGNGTPRQLAESELDGAAIKRGATIVVLRDGRTLSGVSIKRVDLRQALAILKAVGIPELQTPRPREEPKAKPAPAKVESLQAVREIEVLVRAPLAPPQVERANRLLLSIARNAPQGSVAHLAMQLMSALHEARVEAMPSALARLRAALEEAERSMAGSK